MSVNRRLTDTTPTCLEKVGSHLKKRLPILTWLPMYKKSKLIADLIAGTTVGLTVVVRIGNKG